MTPILLDTDPGGDDAVALMWLAALAHRDEAELVAVSTVDGNVEPERTYANACGLLELCGLGHVPVGRGAPCAVARRRAARVHGADGLGGQSSLLPPPRQPFAQAPNSVRLIIDTLEARPGEVTLLAIGPLSNLAAADRLRPGVLWLARDIVVMGGGFAAGNITPVAEFNIHFDPASAAVCVDTRPDLHLVPLDLTLGLELTQERIGDALDGAGTSTLAQLLDGLTRFMIRSAIERGTSGDTGGFPVHDAATVAAVFYPDTLEFSEGMLTVDVSDGPDAGRTTFSPGPGDSQPARVAFRGRTDALLDALGADLRQLLADAGQSA